MDTSAKPTADNRSNDATNNQQLTVADHRTRKQPGSAESTRSYVGENAVRGQGVTFRGDSRGAAIQVGATLLFGILIIQLSLYQAHVVPSQNEGIEWRHLLNVQSDMQSVGAAISTVGSTGDQQSVTIGIGTQYPSRVLAVNAPPPRGSLRTTTEGQITSNFFNVTEVCGYDATTRSLVYRPNYHYHQEAPTIVYENTVVYRNYSGTLLVDQEQTLISNATISLVPFAGSLSADGTDTVTLSLQGGPDHAKTNTSESAVRLTVPSRLSASVWKQTILEDEIDDPNDGVDEPHNYVTDVQPNASDSNAVDIFLESGKTYTLGCRAVGANRYPPSGQASLHPGRYGTGNTQQYQGSSTETVTGEGGVLVGIVDAQQINLTDPQFSATRADNGQLTETKRYIRFGFTLTNGSVGSAEYRKYYIVVGTQTGMAYTVDSSGDIAPGSWSEHSVFVYRQDETGVTKLIDGADLDQPALTSWAKHQRELDVLDESNYNSPSSVQQSLQEVEDWLNNDDEVDLFVVDVHGRFDVTIE